MDVCTTNELLGIGFAVLSGSVVGLTGFFIIKSKDRHDEGGHKINCQPSTS